MLHKSKTRNSPCHPQSSGLVERLNRTIEDMISKFVSKNKKDWDLYLPYLMMAHKSSVHDTMGETSCFIMMGMEVTLSIDHVVASTQTTNQSHYQTM